MGGAAITTRNYVFMDQEASSLHAASSHGLSMAGNYSALGDETTSRGLGGNSKASRGEIQNVMHFGAGGSSSAAVGSKGAGPSSSSSSLFERLNRNKKPRAI
jgi:hypothetical protein